MEYSTWEPNKSSWSVRERRAWSTVRTPFVHLILFICLDHESSGRVTHDSHKLLTKAINHSTHHYMNRRELESDQLIQVPLLDVLSFPPSAGRPKCIVTIARRRVPHLTTTRKDTTAATVLRYTATHIRTETTCNRQNRVRIEAIQAATRVIQHRSLV